MLLVSTTNFLLASAKVLKNEIKNEGPRNLLESNITVLLLV